MIVVEPCFECVDKDQESLSGSQANTFGALSFMLKQIATLAFPVPRNSTVWCVLKL